MSRAFLTAGVSSLVTTLWLIPDQPSAFLMTRFYENLAAGQDKAQALRQAMLATKARYPEPRNWAAFTLMGEAE
ncbi:MAG: CHAT domain-containing protein [Spirulinaceae cyanobacterium RM2_2_10]|nr:CHAT domain-containing protein [Spirulinaceae cyanobacterium RM2_2_10]